MRQRIFLYSFILLDPLFLLRDAKSAANPAMPSNFSATRVLESATNVRDCQARVTSVSSSTVHPADGRIHLKSDETGGVTSPVTIHCVRFAI